MMLINVLISIKIKLYYMRLIIITKLLLSDIITIDSFCYRVFFFKYYLNSQFTQKKLLLNYFQLYTTTSYLCPIYLLLHFFILRLVCMSVCVCIKSIKSKHFLNFFLLKKYLFIFWFSQLGVNKLRSTISRSQT